MMYCPRFTVNDLVLCLHLPLFSFELAANDYELLLNLQVVGHTHHCPARADPSHPVKYISFRHLQYIHNLIVSFTTQSSQP